MSYLQKFMDIQTLTYLKPDTYSELFQRFKMKLFPRRLILDLWAGSEYANLPTSNY